MAPTWFDITKQWHDAHGHLVPFECDLPVESNQSGTSCQLCGVGPVVDLVAQVRSVHGDWSESTDVKFCYGCRRFAVANCSGLWSFQNYPSAVNGRLWTRSPTVLNLEPTTRCNFNCWYCIGRTMIQRDLSFSDFLKILDNFPSLRLLALVGEGEPLLHADFFDMVNAARERGVRTVLTTNGSTLSRAVVQKLCETQVLYVSVSLDGATRDSFASTRIGGDLAQVIAGVKRLCEYRDSRGLRYPRVGLKGTLLKDTAGTIEEIVELARESGIDIFEGFQPLNVMPSYSACYPKSAESELVQIGSVYRAMEERLPTAASELVPMEDFLRDEGLPVDRYGRSESGKCCDESWLFASSSGRVMPCCRIKRRLDTEWNLKESSVKEIETDYSYENMRFNLFNGIFMSSCVGCSKVGSNAMIARDSHRFDVDA